MQIKLREIDLRRDQSGSISVDDENSNLVGQLLFSQNRGRTIFLLGKYRGDYKTQAECQAFADGVVSVLNHMTTMTPPGHLR